MRMILVAALLALCSTAVASPASAGAAIENPTGKYLVWKDYKIEINQYGGLGRDWPYNIVWQQYDVLAKEAQANPIPPNTIKALLLVCPKTEATAYKKHGDTKIEVGKRTTSMTSAEVRWALQQWRQWERLVYVYSGGAAWLRTDVKVIDEPLKVRTNDKWGFWSGPKLHFIDKYIPFKRGEYHSYNSIYNSKGLAAGPWGGTFGADIGPRGCGSSDNAWLARGPKVDERHGFVFWHEWLNQMCWATSNVMPHPQRLWSLYVFNRTGYRRDPINAWPWITSHRDDMRFVIRPAMWRRWTVIDPCVSPAIEEWVMFGPLAEPQNDEPRRISLKPASEGKLIHMKLGTYDHFNPAKALGKDEFKPARGVYYFRTYVNSQKQQEVRLWAGADERFQLWLNGVMVRDGWGTLRSRDHGRLIEKVTYTSLHAGANTLVLVLPNTDEKSDKIIEFRVRFCKTDGSGEPPAGVTCTATLSGTKPLPLANPVVRDFHNPRLYKWADVGDDPWLKLPRLDKSAMRELTGIDTLEIKTEGVPYKVTVKDNRGKSREKRVIPKQHLFLSVPKDAVTSPWVEHPTENTEALNNDLDFNWESLAWLRLANRGDSTIEKDVLLVRFDVVEPVLHLLKTNGRPAHESIVGYLLIDYKIAYVVLVDLAGTPRTELDCLCEQPQ